MGPRKLQGDCFALEIAAEARQLRVQLREQRLTPAGTAAVQIYQDIICN